MMDYNIARKDGEINHLLNKSEEATEKGETSYNQLTYEDGVKDAILWVTGKSDKNPLED